MRRATRTFVALLGLGVVPLTAVPALAEYGAIAWDEATGKRGASWHEPTAKRAAEAAIGECGTSGCKVVTSSGPGCAPHWRRPEDGKNSGRGLAQGSRRSPSLQHLKTARRATR